jgi:hypothetical protein
MLLPDNSIELDRTKLPTVDWDWPSVAAPELDRESPMISPTISPIRVFEPPSIAPPEVLQAWALIIIVLPPLRLKVKPVDGIVGGFKIKEH